MIAKESSSLLHVAIIKLYTRKKSSENRFRS